MTSGRFVGGRQGVLAMVIPDVVYHAQENWHAI
jgi:hypothetical protein